MRTGKIARLPYAMREQVNRRIDTGERARPLLKWLNALPEVQTVLERDFKGQPVSAQNLSEWRNGGYRDWLARQEALAFVTELDAIDSDSQAPQVFDLPEKLACWVALRYAAIARDACAPTDDPEADWRRLREFGHNVTELLRGHQNTQRLRLERERFDESMHHKRQEEERQKRIQSGEEGIRAETIERIERELRLM